MLSSRKVKLFNCFYMCVCVRARVPKSGMTASCGLLIFYFCCLPSWRFNWLSGHTALPQFGWPLCCIPLCVCQEFFTWLAVLSWLERLTHTPLAICSIFSWNNFYLCCASRFSGYTVIDTAHNKRLYGLMTCSRMTLNVRSIWNSISTKLNIFSKRHLKLDWISAKMSFKALVWVQGNVKKQKTKFIPWFLCGASRASLSSECLNTKTKNACKGYLDNYWTIDVCIFF